MKAHAVHAVARATALALGGVFAATVFAAPPGHLPLSDIAAGVGGFVIDGAGAGDNSGNSVAGIGDVNGDGLSDLIVGAPYADGSNSGRSYVVFGNTRNAAIDLSAIATGRGGFVVKGDPQFGSSGVSVDGAGDVNGDGLVDLLVWASGPYGGRRVPGRGYVVFGKTGTSAIELSDVAAGSGGFGIVDDRDAFPIDGSNIASAGDVNGDGLADVMIGGGSRFSYVVFGKTDTGTVDLSRVADGRGGFVISPPGGYFIDVSGAGDVNADGLADLIVGAPYDDGSRADGGRSFVVFGKTDTGAVDLSAITAGDGGFVINGQCRYDRSGYSVAGAGDINGDGLADVIVGAPGANYYSNDTGRTIGFTYVVFGKTGTDAVELSSVSAGAGGFVIKGAGLFDNTGREIAAAGDLNGDGLADVVIGSRIESLPEEAYIVFGKSDTAAVNLSGVKRGRGGFVMVAERKDNATGYALAGAGDVNGDGLADLAVTAPNDRASGSNNAGRTYVILGATTGVFAPSAVDQLGSEADDTLTGTSAGDVLVGGAGNDTLVGGGGPDALIGGPGDDTLVLGRGGIKALSEGFKAGAGVLARLDGGTGVDTLALDGSGLTLDLRLIANPGGSDVGSRSRIESIERIDLGGSGNNTLALAVSDVQDITGMNRINRSTQDALDWRNGSYEFPKIVKRHQLVVDGNAGDVALAAADTWARMGTAFNGGRTYVVYNSIGGRSQMLVNQEITRSEEPATGLRRR